MNDLYLALGRTIAGLCPPGFQRAVLDAAMAGDKPALSLVCKDADGAEQFPPIDAAARDALLAALTAARDAQTGADGKAWSRCTVTLSAGGGFAMDVGYPDDDGGAKDEPGRRDGLQILIG